MSVEHKWDVYDVDTGSADDFLVDFSSEISKKFEWKRPMYHGIEVKIVTDIYPAADEISGRVELIFTANCKYSS